MIQIQHFQLINDIQRQLHRKRIQNSRLTRLTGLTSLTRLTKNVNLDEEVLEEVVDADQDQDEFGRAQEDEFGEGEVIILHVQDDVKGEEVVLEILLRT